MPDLDKVIKGLECCILRNPEDHARCSQCSYGGNCVNRLKMDALELLKLMRPKPPRVIRKDELWNLPGGSVVWMEERTIIEECPEPVIPVCFEDIQDVTIGNNPKVHSAIAFNGRYDRMDQYGTMYRFWTARPTEEQSRGEKWEG